jgi:hypothetical protein
MMKKTLSIVLALCFLLLAGCGGSKTEANTIRDGKSLSDVMNTVSEEYSTTYSEKYGEEVNIVAMAMEVDKQILSDMCSIDESDVSETAGWISMSMTNCDAFFAVKAADGKIDTVTQALSERVQALIAQYELYPVSGSYERAQAGKVYVKGDYAFLIVVGYDPDYAEDVTIYDEQVQFVMDKIAEQFN